MCLCYNMNDLHELPLQILEAYSELHYNSWLDTSPAILRLVASYVSNP